MLLHDLQDLNALPAAMAGAVLQLAMNCSKPSTAAAAAYSIADATDSAARSMPAILQPSVACRLLLTAASRQHTEAVQQMVALPVIQQHLDAATLEEMLWQLLFDHHCIKILCQLPVAAELSTDTATQLLLAAYQENAYKAGRVLCKLDAARQLSREQVEALLQVLMAQPAAYDGSYTWRFWQAFYRLPGAKQLSSSAVVRLLRAAANLRRADVSEHLCKGPAAADISSADVASLLCEAFATPADDDLDLFIKDAMQLPAFQQLNVAEVAQLLHAAAQHYSTAHETSDNAGLTALCDLAAADDLSSEQVLLPLQLVVHRSDKCTEALCQLPAVEQLSSEAVAQLLQAAVGADKCHCTNALWDLPAAQQLDSAAVAQLLETAVVAGSIGGIARIVNLRAAVQLSGYHLASALTTAARYGSLHHEINENNDCLQRLCELPSAAMLSKEQVAEAVESALLRSAGVSFLRQLLKLPAAARLGSTQVAQLLLAGAAAAMLPACSSCASCQQHSSSAVSNLRRRWKLLHSGTALHAPSSCASCQQQRSSALNSLCRCWRQL
jgi:hypothetical protein